MYQWRKFDFFEEKLAGKCSIPDDVSGNITCCSSGRGRVVVGCDDGTVSLLDRGLKFNYGFQAHSSSVHFLQQLKQRNYIVTVGEDEQVSPQTSATCLKVFDLDKMEPESSSTTSPDCIQILRIFTSQFSEAKITSFIVLEEAPPILLITIGLDNGCIYCIKGDIARERITRVNYWTPEAVYFYEVDGRGPCWAFEGEKRFVGWFRGYLLCVIADQRNGKNTFNIYDLKNRLIAHSLVVKEDMESKLDMLFKKNLYSVAINLVQSQHADAAATSEVLRKYGDHLYSKQEYDEAMSQYILAIGHLEPSEDGVGEHKFDIETAIRVCRAANYHEHAMYVAKKAGRHEWYLKILLEDLGSYDEALQYISSLEPSQSGVTVKEYGKILVEHKPTETIEILIRLCTEEGDSSKKGVSNGADIQMLPSPVDFLNIFVHHPRPLMVFLEKYTDKVKNSSAEVEINNTLLELYLSKDLNFPSLSQLSISDGVRGSKPSGALLPSKAQSNGKLIANGEISAKSKDREERFQKGLRLLKSAWPSDQENPQYDVDLAIILCEMNNFKEGLLYLYEKLKLYKEVIACYMQAHDHEGLIACCKKLGDSVKGGDPTLWADLLKYFGELGEDCTKEVKEVLTYIERDDILPPIVVIQTLSKNPCLTLSVIKDYIARKLEQESKLIEDDRRSIEKYQEETATMRKEIQDLRTNARIFQLSKCTACTFTLDLPAVHFMCMHSFHQRCLGDNEKECPECAPEYRSVLETKRNLEQNANDQDRFFQQVKNSKDGFSVIAEYFGKGIISKTSPAQDNNDAATSSTLF
ncbi:unnamed protein product [Rhodiola kirilowii]